MSTIEDASKLLGEYLLKGWTMTDDRCPVEQNCVVPGMRSHDRTQYICVIHSSVAPEATPPNQGSSSPPSSRSETCGGRSTPPTPFSFVMDEPSTFDLPPPSAETLRRRQQSDLASQRIAQKMLQGFAMLGEECLNDECFGVPLIRPPRRDGTKDPRKECVICGNVYTETRDSRGFTTLQRVVPPPPETSLSTSAPTVIAAATRSTAEAPRVQASDAKVRDVKGKGKENLPITVAGNEQLEAAMGSLARSVQSISEVIEAMTVHAGPSDLDTFAISEAARLIVTVMEARRAVQKGMTGDS